MQRRAKSGKGLARRRTRRNGELKAERVRRICNPRDLGFDSTSELEPLHLGTTVQKRALDAIQLGLGLRTRGYHLFVLGEADSGKTSTMRLLLSQRAEKEPTPPDICYLHDFDCAGKPRPVKVPASKGTVLATNLDELVRELQKSIPRTLTSDSFGIKRRGAISEYQAQIDGLHDALNHDIAEMGFELRPEGGSFVPVPVRDGQPLDDEQFAALPLEERTAYEKSALSLRDKMLEHDLRIQRIELDMEKSVLETERQAIRPIVEDAVGERKRVMSPLSTEMPAFLDRLGAHVVENHRRFLPQPVEEDDDTHLGESPSEELYTEYRINVVVSRREGEGAPVVFERQPTQGRLLGFLEYRESKGALKADHMSIRAGALQRADGGYVVLQASDLAKRPLAWEALKRALRDREVRIDEPEDDGRPRTAGAVRPVPTELGSKVILVGTPEAYYQLLICDEEFARLFKVKAEFEPSIAWNRKNIMRISRFLAQVTEQEGHLHLDATAVARFIEYAARETGDQRRLSTRVAGFLDLLAEVDFRARRGRRRIITRRDVDVALEERRRRHSSDEDDILRTIREGTLLVNTTGSVVGQINGLVVLETGDHAFGLTTRITARTWVGKAGVVNIDREVHLSGRIHDKGTLILIGLLGNLYAQERPLSLSASITFEQSYEMVEGDSASVAELISLLSSLSALPINQGIAVTGSIDQQGEIQPVGGVNEKIEGMYRACKLQGLDGSQGVVIPRRNARHLMVETEVVKAVADGNFHIWTIDHIDEAIELLIGTPAGKRRKDGSWQPGTVHDLVDRRLAEMVDCLIRLDSSRI